MEEFKTLLFEKKAIFFVCGSLSMDKDINNIFITAHKEAGLKPYIAMTKVKELQRDKRIVKEVYGWLMNTNINRLTLWIIWESSRIIII